MEERENLCGSGPCLRQIQDFPALLTQDCLKFLDVALGESESEAGCGWQIKQRLHAPIVADPAGIM